jgi:hypothetical protein
VIAAGDLDEARALDVSGDVAAFLHLHVTVAVRVHHERRHADGG